MEKHFWIISSGRTRTIESLLFYTTNDVLLILVYFGIVKEHKNNHQKTIKLHSDNRPTSHIE